MKHIVRKAYWNYEKEEKWLNEMSAKGMALTDYSWCRYVFEQAQNNEYIYRIELLKYLPTHAESIAYIKFLEENGVECVATYMRWIYLRKKASEGAFDIYSDIESKITHYKRILIFWNTIMCIEFMISPLCLLTGIINLNFEDVWRNSAIFDLVVGSLGIILGIIFLMLVLPIRKKIKMLQRERIIRE